MKIFVTGTDTDVGKTLVSAWLCLKFNCDYFKPIQAGLEPDTDSAWVRARGVGKVHPETYRLREPASPHWAAEQEGLQLKLSRFRLPDANRLVVEGAGGVMVPLAPGCLMLDLIEKLNLPVLLVASTRLGTLNHTLLSLHALRARGISVLGVVLNGPPSSSTVDAIESFGNTTVLQQLPRLETVDSACLEAIEPGAALRHLFGQPARIPQRTE